MEQHWPSIAGCPVCYFEGDEVTTRDGRVGTVLGYNWDHDLVLYKDGKPSKGFFIVIVDFVTYTEKFIRHDLTGKRFPTRGFITKCKTVWNRL